MSEKCNESKISKFVLGGLAGMSATCIVQPFDLMKSRLQVHGEGAISKKLGPIQLFFDIKKNEGIRALYNGLSAALSRQITYTAGRMGAFDSLNSFYLEKFDKTPNLPVKMAIGSLAGAVGAILGTPTEVALIRMTVDARSQTKKPSLFKLWQKIFQSEGLKGLYAGCVPTIYRSMVVNCIQLASYSQIKEELKKLGIEKFPNYFCASFISGFMTSVVSLPVDMAKTRLQKVANNSTTRYSNSFGVISSVVRNEGPMSLWKGFFPYYVKLGSHTVLCFLFLEKYKEIYASIYQN